jgi:hypothetical protein
MRCAACIDQAEACADFTKGVSNGQKPVSIRRMRVSFDGGDVPFIQRHATWGPARPSVGPSVVVGSTGPQIAGTNHERRPLRTLSSD